jgi:S1-C subfamily serine protease
MLTAFGRILVIAAMLLLPPALSLAVPAKTFDSVVSVLPLWPGYSQGGRAGAPPGQDPEGSGVAVLPGGYVATALHVIDRATKVDVRLVDGRVLPAEIVGRDRPTDIALLRVEEDLPLLPEAPSQLRGEPVCALSNAFGLDLSVTCGVVSALHRSGTGFNSVEDFVQTDAAVNPGSSGGALVDRQGRLVGMLSAIFTKRSDANIGVNFAVSRDMLMRVVEDLAAHGEVLAAGAGVSVTNATGEGAQRSPGVLVAAVDSEGPAAGILRPGDHILLANGRSLRAPSDWRSIVYLHRPGEELTVERLRDGAVTTEILRLIPER